MNNLLKLITFFSFLILLSCDQSPLIEDYKIENISLGDSLIEKYSKDEILKYQWNHYLDRGYNSSSFFPESSNSEYDQIEVGYKTNDSRYIVLSISGGIIYDTNVENCYPKKKEIIKKLSQILKNTDWKITIYEDDKGKYDLEYLLLETGEYVVVECTDWSTDTENNLDWVDNLRVRISSAEWEDMK